MKKYLTKTKEVLENIVIYMVGIIIITNMLAFFCMGNVLGIIVHLFFKLAVISILICVTNKKRMPFIVFNVLEYVFGILNYLKIKNRCQVLEPWDLTFGVELADIASFLRIELADVGLFVVILIFMIAITIMDIYAFENYCDIPSKKGKCGIFLITIPILIFLCTNYMQINMKYVEANMNGYANYSIYRRTSEYGALTNFFLDLGLIGLEESDLDYSKEKVNEIYLKVNQIEDINKVEYDNVIILLLESYFDVTQFENINFDKDPLKNYRKYLQEHPETKLLVDNIGGGTANVEYRVLTMHSVEQYHEGLYPYMHIIKNNMETLPSLFKQNGYETTAIHNYKDAFYKRNEAYEKMGIDTFISDDDFVDPKYYGEYIADEEVYNKIVEIIESQDKSFITATTMGTHSPYIGTVIEEYDEMIEKEEWPLAEIEGFNSYVQKLRKLDEALGLLIEYVKQSDEKTLLIAYGDHYPLMYNIPKYEGIVDLRDENLIPEKYPILFEMPYLVVSNVQDDIKLKEKIIPSEMGMYILENVKLEKISPLYNAIYSYFKGELTKEEYELIQYDNVQGNSYWKEYWEK